MDNFLKNVGSPSMKVIRLNNDFLHIRTVVIIARQQFLQPAIVIPPLSQNLKKRKIDETIPAAATGSSDIPLTKRRRDMDLDESSKLTEEQKICSRPTIIVVPATEEGDNDSEEISFNSDEKVQTKFSYQENKEGADTEVEWKTGKWSREEIWNLAVSMKRELSTNDAFDRFQAHSKAITRERNSFRQQYVKMQKEVEYNEGKEYCRNCHCPYCNRYHIKYKPRSK
jgi:hypothetical protein